MDTVTGYVMYVFVAFLVSDAYFHIVNAFPTDILSAEKHYIISIRVNKVEGVSKLVYVPWHKIYTFISKLL